MDPFNDKFEDEEDEETEQEDSINDQTLSPKHTNGRDDDIDFKRVSLPAMRPASESKVSDGVNERDIDVEMAEKSQNDIERNEDAGVSISDPSGEDIMGKAKRRKLNFGQDSDSDDDEDLNGKNKKKSNQGAIVGVFIPCLQNILGIILFVRLPSITGEAGLFQTYVLIALCKSATLLTTLSMNAIATNGKMSKGGAYYLLSRSLGPATGGSLGILFYIATTVSGAMYILGSVETFMIASGYGTSHGIMIRLLSLILLLIILAINWVGISYVSKAGIVFFIVTCISIFSIFIGLLFASLRTDSLPDGITGMSFSNFGDNFESDYKEGSSFFIIIAIFFPACTGIMAGSNRSGDLKDPSKSIPKGTLSAHLTTTTGYYIFTFLFAIVAKKRVLLDEDIIFVAEVAWPFKFIVHAGIIFSSLGAALQCLAGAPKLLTAIAGDDLLPFLKIFNRNALWPLCLNFCICFIAILIGSLDAVAPIVTIFFLALYGGINAACFLLDWQGSPNWRPTWKYFHKLTALGGLVL